MRDAIVGRTAKNISAEEVRRITEQMLSAGNADEVEAIMRTHPDLLSTGMPNAPELGAAASKPPLWAKPPAVAGLANYRAAMRDAIVGGPHARNSSAEEVDRIYRQLLSDL